MKLGELFIQLGVVGDTKELDKTIKQLDKSKKFGKELIKTFVSMTASITASVVAFDRLANAMFKANQQMITFQRTSGISLNTLNKYASASSLVNYNASLQGTAQSLQNVASNLWDIQMGRGDISPFQELAFVGGKGINPFGKSLEDVIEEIRESIKTVDDLQATNIITRMGFAPEDLMMLRMTKKELAEINSLFLSPVEQETLNKYALQVKKLHLELSLVGQRMAMKIMPIFIKFLDHVTRMADRFLELWNTCKQFRLEIAELGLALGAFFTFLNPKLVALSALVTGLLLLLDDIAVYFMGGESYFGDAMNWLENVSGKEEDKKKAKKAMENLKEKDKNVAEIVKNNPKIEKNKNLQRAMSNISEADPEWRQHIGQRIKEAPERMLKRFIWSLPVLNQVKDLAPTPTELREKGLDVKINNETNIHTTQPADKAMADNINNMVAYSQYQNLAQYT